MSAHLRQHRWPRLRFRVAWRLRRFRAFKFITCRGCPPDNQRYAEAADRDTRQETGDKPEQARHCLPPISIRLSSSLLGIDLSWVKMLDRVKSDSLDRFLGPIGSGVQPEARSILREIKPARR